MSAQQGRSAPWIFLLFAGAVALVALGLWRGKTHNVERAALPTVDGRIVVAGLDAPVEILRDEHGVPHVIAASEPDAWFGLGFAHAQDRLGQMLWRVRLARGRSAEIIGRDGLAADRLARLLDLGGIADREWQEAPAESRAWLEAYARGVNARIARIESGEVGLPVAAVTAGLPVEPWRPADTLALLKLHAWTLGSSLEASMVLYDLLGTLGGVDARPFFPGGGEELPSFGDAPPLQAEASGAGSRSPAPVAWVDPLRRAAGLAGSSAGSSAWVLGGAHTLGGLPLLAADFHVQPTAPALFHFAHVRGGDLDVAGAMLPGVPVVWTGRTVGVTWASTHARAVVTDLYEELVKDGSTYFDGRRWLPLDERSETISVRGAPDETLVVKGTAHGPLIEGTVTRGELSLAMSWVGLRGRGIETLDAWRAAAGAGDAGALREALAGVGEPAVAVVYADHAGEAGLQVAGWIPRRPLDTDLVPVPGRAQWFDWKGRIPFDRLPRKTLKNGQGWLIAADNPLPHPGVERPEWLWRDGVRARRIDSRLRELHVEEPVGLGPLTEIQSDTVDPRAAALVRAALALAGDATERDPQTAEVAQLLEGWDGRSQADSASAAAYHAFVSALTRRLLEPSLGNDLLTRYLDVSQVDPIAVVARMVRGASGSRQTDAWTDRGRVTSAVNESLRDAWFRLSSELGASRRKWSWGRLHPLRFAPTPPTPRAPMPVLGPMPMGGSGATIATAEYAPGEPFDVRLASLVRFAADPGDPEGFRAALAPGQSEHPRSPHFSDGIEPWRAGRLVRIPFSEARVREAAQATLVLEPAP